MINFFHIIVHILFYLLLIYFLLIFLLQKSFLIYHLFQFHHLFYFSLLFLFLLLCNSGFDSSISGWSSSSSSFEFFLFLFSFSISFCNSSIFEFLFLFSNFWVELVFISSNFFDGRKCLSTPCGSPCYASPEMVAGNNYDGFNIDILLLSMISWTIFSFIIRFFSFWILSSSSIFLSFLVSKKFGFFSNFFYF